jgi:casein kinase 1
MVSSSSNVVGTHYHVWKKIGEGSFGVVFEGTDLSNNQEVAIKFVRQQPPHNQYMGTRRYAGSEIEYPIDSKIIYSHFRRIQEPRKSDAPQLRDEYRTYKLLERSCQYAQIRT